MMGHRVRTHLWIVGGCLLSSLWGARVVHAQDVWTAAQNVMATPRDAHAALVIGGRVLIIGGRTNPGGTTTARTEFFDPVSSQFTATGSMAGSRSFFPPVVLDNGKVLAAGGYRQSTFGRTIRVAELFDPTSGTWTATGSMEATREQHTATKLANGHVLIAGGFSNNVILASAEIYDPATSRFSVTGKMRATRFGHTASLTGGQVLVIGGRTTGDVSRALTEFFGAGAWTEGPRLRQDRYRHTATTLPDGRILITGGYSSSHANTLASAEIYNPLDKTFRLLPATMSDTRMDHTVTLLPDGRVLIAGGWSSVKKSTVASVDIFDPAAEAFTAIAPLPVSRHEHTATLLPDGKTVLVAGGLHVEQAAPQTLSDASLYSLPALRPPTPVGE